MCRRRRSPTPRRCCTSIQLVTEAAWRRRVAVPPQLWLLTRGAMPVDGGVTAPTEGALWGLVRTVAAELPLFYGGMIDLDPSGDDADGSPTWSTTSGDETWLGPPAAVRPTSPASDRRRRPERDPVARSAEPTAPTSSRAVSARSGWRRHGRSSSSGARRLILVGRSPVPARATWADIG